MGMERLFALISVLSLLAGCGSSAPACNPSPTFSSPPYLTGIKSSSGNLTLSVSLDPASTPPEQRCFGVQYVVTDSSGAPVDGLELTVQPWMVQMGHGSSVVPTVTAKGQGIYVLTSVDLFMAGEWQLRTGVDGGVTDTFSPTIQVD
jgi:hypothetical protein